MRKYLLGIALCFALVGCSAKQKIYDGAHKVQQLAISSRDLAVEITEISTQPEVVVLADQIITKQEEIHTVAEDVKEASTKVRDIIPWWARLIKQVLAVAALAGVAYLTYVYIVPIRMIVGRFIPKRRSQASFVRKLLNRDTSREEYVANWRADPANEAAYRSVKKKEAKHGIK